MKKILIACFLLLTTMAFAQNPIVPGYFADPSIRYMDGKYYLSITSDGYDDHNGEPFIWVSDDLVNWDIHYLNITTVSSGLRVCSRAITVSIIWYTSKELIILLI